MKNNNFALNLIKLPMSLNWHADFCARKTTQESSYTISWGLNLE